MIKTLLVQATILAIVTCNPLHQIYDDIEKFTHEQAENLLEKIDKEAMLNTVMPYLEKMEQASPQLSDSVKLSNITCMARHCIKQTFDCFTDHSCRSQIWGINFDCKGDSGCIWAYEQSFDTTYLGPFMKCLFIDYECLAFPEPDAINNKTCQHPVENTIKNLDREVLNGDWDVVEGYSHIYDCINCTWVNMQIHEDNTIDYKTAYYYLQGKNGPIWQEVQMNGVYDPENGMIHFHGEQTGLLHHEHWYIMHTTENAWAMYYCGDAGTWKYEGALVMAKSFDKFDEQQRQEIKQTYLEHLDFDEDTFCPIYKLDACDSNPFRSYY